MCLFAAIPQEGHAFVGGLFNSGIGASELGEGGSGSFQDKLTRFEMTQVTTNVEYTAEGFNEQVPRHSLAGTVEGGVTNECFENSSRSVAFTQMNQGANEASTGITLRETTKGRRQKGSFRSRGQPRMALT